MSDEHMSKFYQEKLLNQHITGKEAVEILTKAVEESELTVKEALQLMIAITVAIHNQIMEEKIGTAVPYAGVG